MCVVWPETVTLCPSALIKQFAIATCHRALCSRNWKPERFRLVAKNARKFTKSQAYVQAMFLKYYPETFVYTKNPGKKNKKTIKTKKVKENTKHGKGGGTKKTKKILAMIQKILAMMQEKKPVISGFLRNFLRIYSVGVPYRILFKLLAIE